MTQPLMTLRNLTGTAVDRRALRRAVPRARVQAQAAAEAVVPLIDDVRERGRAAVLDAGERFDGVRPQQLRVAPEQIRAAVAGLDDRLRAALEETIERCRAVAAAEVRTPATTSFPHGGSVTTRWLPVERVGLYVPGGLAVYPSTVVMNAVPAQAAGVGSIALTSPPQPDGQPHPTVLAAAGLLGIEEVWAMGGAQSIAALAYGFDDAGEVLEPVDLITGPGNAYVAAAKAAVRDIVGIDTIAGPTEIIILADAQADAELIAADLISQAEHDPAAAAVLVTDSPELAEQVQQALQTQVPEAVHAERIRQALAGEQSAILLVDSQTAGIAVVNAYAGEHVEVHTAEPQAVAAQITSAGAIFIGASSPVALGDYCAGSNHVLPTSGTAAYASALGVQSFLRSSQLIDYPAAALAEVADHIETLAAAENLPAHGQAVRLRRSRGTERM